MTTLQIIGGAVLLVICIGIIIICLMQDQRPQDAMASAALTGMVTDSFYGKNEGRTKEAQLNKITRFFGIILFVATLAVNLIPLFVENK